MLTAHLYLCSFNDRFDRLGVLGKQRLADAIINNHVRIFISSAFNLTCPNRLRLHTLYLQHHLIGNEVMKCLRCAYHADRVRLIDGLMMRISPLGSAKPKIGLFFSASLFAYIEEKKVFRKPRPTFEWSCKNRAARWTRYA